jgi:ribosomal protein S28E/S33
LAHLKRTDYCRDLEGENIQANFKRMMSDDGERKILRNVFGLVKENYVWRIRNNHELIDLKRESDVVSEIGKARLRWLEYVERMPEERTAKKVFRSIPEGKRSVSKTRNWWLNIAENYLNEIGV